MKERAIYLFIFLIISYVGWTQSPQFIPYQAVARDASGSLIENQAVSLRLSIHDLSATGTVVYQEVQTATTSKLGLFNLNVGQGTSVTGTFSTINWASGTKYLQVELDPSGGSSYQNMGTSQMMSVPYALYANSASPGGTASGDLSGSYPNPTVAAINGSALGLTTATSGNLLIGTGSLWQSQAMSGDGTISGTGVFTLGSSSNNYIKNQTGSVQTAGFNINGVGTLVGGLNVGSSNQFQISSSGAIAAATGLISSGTIKFTALTTSTNNPLHTLYADNNGVVNLGVNSTAPSSNGALYSFFYNGYDQMFIVPTGVFSVTVKLWGAGGGAGYNTSDIGSGGAGGYTTGTLAVTPGEAITVIVGSPGCNGCGANYGGGGAGTGSQGGSGGGRSAIRRGATELATAGGGGGGCRDHAVTNGGAGGGLTGGNADNNGTPTGGTQTGSGTGGGSVGTQFQGGNGVGSGNYAGGGGGGGYWGGCGGGNNQGGSGGSSYYGGLTGGSTTAGNYTTCDNCTCYPAVAPPYSNIGFGASRSQNTGGPGLVQFSW